MTEQEVEAMFDDANKALWDFVMAMPNTPFPVKPDQAMDGEDV